MKNITHSKEKVNTSDFDIRNYLDLLGDRTKEGKYICPNCGGHNLSSNGKTGKYNCFNCKDTKAIFKAIKQKAGEWEEKWKKPARPENFKYFYYPDRNGKPLVRVKRIDHGNGKKKFSQQRWDADKGAYIPGLKGIDRENIPVYRCREVRQAIADGKKIFIVEGETSADALWELGIPATTNIGGSGKWKESDFQDLKGAKVVICPDRDITGIKHAEDIAKDFPDAKWLYAYPESGLWKRLNFGGGADVADWIKEHNLTAEDIYQAVEDKQRELKPAGQNESSDTGNSQPSVKFKPGSVKWDKSTGKWKISGTGSPAANKRFLLEELGVGDRLRLNTLKHEYEIDGKSVSEMYPSGVGYDLPTLIDETFGFYFTGALDKFYALIEQVATKFHPVRDYLRNLPLQSPDFINEFITKSLGITEPIKILMVRAWSIGAARRVLSDKPVKFDTALILKGPQGICKSTFFKVLAGEEFFGDDMGNVSDKDEKIKPHGNWLNEWAELENVCDKEKESRIKAYLSGTTDNIRPPYARSAKDLIRGFAICGTTNKNEFLTDQTGNRRFFVVRLPHKKGEKIDIDFVRQNRDKFWGAVITAAANNEPHWLNNEDAALAELEADKVVWRNPDVQDVLIPVFYEKLKAGDKKISRQEINDILERADKKQTVSQLDKFMSTYELTKKARNISYTRPGETFPKTNYRGFNLLDDDGQVPPKLLQAFKDFDLELSEKPVTSQSQDLVTNSETLTATESSHPVTETTDSIADDTFKPGDKVIDLESGEELVVTKETTQANGQYCWVKSEKRLEYKAPSWSLQLASQPSSPARAKKSLKPGDKVKILDKTGEKIGTFLKEMFEEFVVYFESPDKWFLYPESAVKPI
ncbi:MAG: VapE family protein [Microcoleaceae cyanobacterium MO_207.B10]|nr:VapE family protein [Microcoleaceae cyanobacterium MO_207.B10]